MKRGTCPFGIQIAQGWETMGLLIEAIDFFHVKTFLELGIWSGAFGEFLIHRNTFVNIQLYYHGYDITTEFLHPRVARLHMEDITIADIFLPDIQTDIAQKIRQTNGAVLLFCDNGNKQKELMTFTPMLRKGDLIAAHDVPVEVPETFLDSYGKAFRDMEEFERDLYRKSALTLWRKIK